MSLYDNSVDFSSFCELIFAIGSTEPKTIQSRRNTLKSNSNSRNNSSASLNPSSTSSQSDGSRNRSIERLEYWLRNLNRIHAQDRIEDEEEVSIQLDHLPLGTCTIFFRLFFPQEGVRRRYGLRESRLIPHLEKYFGKKIGRFNHWCSNLYEAAGSGCLGMEIMISLSKEKDKINFCASGGGLSFGRVEELLDELAAKNSFSHKEVRTHKTTRSVLQILRNLLDPLTIPEKAIMIQIILQDLNPILYPPPRLTRLDLTDFNTKGYDRIDLIDAMRVWNKAMPRLYRIKADLDVVTRELEESSHTLNNINIWKPTIGIAVQVPKSERPGIASVATKNLSGLVAVENKYDGERLQIHVDTSLPFNEQIQIFSKSGRDSSKDRKRLIPIIRAALGHPLSVNGSAPYVDPRLFRRIPTSISFNPAQKYILEGEMLPYNEAESRIDEFWTLTSVKAGFDPSINVTSTSYSQVNNVMGGNSQDSVETGHTESYEASLERRVSEERRKRTENKLNLMIVWFDLLLVDDESLLDCPYEERRARLTSLVSLIPGYSMIAEQTIIDFTSTKSALTSLIDRLADVIVSRGEGLMLKPLQSKYNDYQRGQKWVKLKKDFIPGAGDTWDFHILGASWTKRRARELGVGPSIMTTFYVGLKCNTLIPGSSKPHYHILFSTSYGLTRDQLAFLNSKLVMSSPQQFNPDSINPTFTETNSNSVSVFGNKDTSFTFSLDKSINSKIDRPSVIFRQSRIFELVGAGFQKSGGSTFYSLRWPRITKFDRIEEDSDPINLERLQVEAVHAMQIIPINAVGAKVDQIYFSWNDTSTASSSPTNRETEKLEWIQKLRRVDKAFEKTNGVLPEWDSIEKMFIMGPKSNLDWTSSLSIPTPSSPSTAKSTTKRQICKIFVDEGYASCGDVVNKRCKKLVPFGSVTNLSGSSSRKGNETSRTVSSQISLDCANPSSSSPSSSSTPPSTATSLGSSILTSTPLTSHTSTATSIQLSSSSPTPIVVSKKCLTYSWTCSIPVLSPTQSYSWTFIPPLTFPGPPGTQTHSIPLLEPFTTCKFYNEPFLVLQGSGWLSSLKQSKSKFIEGYIIAVSEVEGRKIQGAMYSKFGFGAASNRQKISVLSLDGWKVELF